ncbi:MAG: efflux RND transporter periplasmic adaptor subunit, partial [Zoogloeaceae bacterium]|nr:efflux RND transporter periplasmic adaptor subunit [Zoogloeaceae bacterium]
MNKPRLGRILSLFLALAAGGILGWHLGARDAAPEHHAQQGKAAREILYWYDPMKPEAHFSQPGKSPFMDMELVPRYADEAQGANAVPASGLGLAPAFTQNLGVRLGAVEKGELHPFIEVSGSVSFDEHGVSVVQARTGGIVERAYPLAVGDRVRAGAPLVDVRTPEWFAAQSEYLALKDVPQLAAAARNRLLQLGMTARQVEDIDRRGQPRAIVTLHAPREGMLSEFDLRQGMTVMPGQTLARINSIGRVWIEAQVPETEAARLSPGGKVTARLTALPGQTLEGRISALIPELKRETRTLRVRVALPNPKGILRPGMLAFIRLEEAKAKTAALLVPTEAVIATGKRHVVIAAPPDGRFIPVEVTPGIETGGKTEILSGALLEGERVVISGQFMIDSEASLRGVLARMSTDPAQTSAGRTYSAIGTVQSSAEDEIVLTHEPVPELEWPSMTMPFTLSKSGLGQGLPSGQRVRFHFTNTEGGPVIERLEVLSGLDAGERGGQTSERKAKTSERKAQTSERKAKTSERKAKTSERKAKTSERKAKTSERKAQT